MPGIGSVTELTVDDYTLLDEGAEVTQASLEAWILGTRILGWK
jgi:hypothetical protein